MLAIKGHLTPYEDQIATSVEISLLLHDEAMPVARSGELDLWVVV